MSAVLCVAPDCRGPRQAAPGLYLCGYHTTMVSTNALRLAELYVELEAVLALPERHGEPVKVSSDHGTVLNERASETMTEIRAVMVSWCLLVAEERGIAKPADRIDLIATYIVTHHEWLSAHAAAGDCAGELDDLRRKAWAVAHPSGARVFDVGQCPAPGCPATVRVILRDSDSLLPSVLRCDAKHDDGCDCGTCPPHEWPASAWRQLGKGLTRGWMTAAEVAAEHRLPMAEVYRLASEQQWRRADQKRPVLYRTEDVLATLRGVAA